MPQFVRIIFSLNYHKDHILLISFLDKFLRLQKRLMKTHQHQLRKAIKIQSHQAKDKRREYCLSNITCRYIDKKPIKGILSCDQSGGQLIPPIHSKKQYEICFVAQYGALITS